MLSINPKEIEIPKLHRYLLGSIGPRPIAFASTIDEHGNVNLAPFSFFNVFSANPPIMIFSPARSGRTNTTKDTYNNVKNIPETVINVVNHNMVHQKYFILQKHNFSNFFCEVEICKFVIFLALHIF